MPGIFSRDTLFSHGNHEPGWVVAPGMQGVDVQPLTANMLTPESLSELMGGPDIVRAAPRRRRSASTTAGCPARRTPTTRTTRCRRRGTRSRGPPPARRRASSPAIRSAPSRRAGGRTGGLRLRHRRDRRCPLKLEGLMTARQVERTRAASVALVGGRSGADLLRRWQRHRERAAARWSRHRVGPHDDLRPDAGHVGAQRQQPGPGGRRLRRPGALDRAEELGRHADAGPRTDVSSCRRTRWPRSARPACWDPSTCSWTRRRTRRRSS